MTLEHLQERRQQLDAAINNTSQSVYLLQGHKAEVDFQITELLKKDSATQVEPECEPVVE